DAEMSGQWANDVVEQLTYQHDPLTAAHYLEQLFGGLFANLWLQNVVKIFFAQKIQAIQADSSQQSMKKAGSESAAGGVCERPSHGHKRHASSPGPALGKTLRIPGKEAHRSERTEFQQRAFHTPIGRPDGRSGGSRPLRVGWEIVHWGQLQFTENHTCM